MRSQLCAEERRREEAEELTEGLRAASQGGLLAAVAEQEATGVGLAAVSRVLAEAELEAAELRGAWQQARGHGVEHAVAARRLVLVAQCREGVLKRDLVEIEVELAAAHAEARLARAALSSGASKAVRAHLASRMGE